MATGTVRVTTWTYTQLWAAQFPRSFSFRFRKVELHRVNASTPALYAHMYARIDH
jgi:hypothetical protein